MSTKIDASSVLDKVQSIIADALYVDKAEVVREASLMKDLGAESIDFLDIVFRLEKEFGIKLPKGDAERRARGNLTDDEFAINGLIQEKGLACLRAAMPEVEPTLIKHGLYVRDIPTLFTVGTFERMASEQLFGVAPRESVGHATVVATATAPLA
jgi:acyl carrier protein